MNISTAKKFIDLLLADKIIGFTSNDISGVILSFIGGEPLLEIDLIREIWEYWLDQLIELKHPWLYFTKGSICSNGVLYFSEKV
jgi:sulfatase maturation enzyme AslB (radical SAM superfamily)